MLRVIFISINPTAMVGFCRSQSMIYLYLSFSVVSCLSHSSLEMMHSQNLTHISFNEILLLDMPVFKIRNHFIKQKEQDTEKRGGTRHSPPAKEILKKHDLHELA